MTNQLVPKGIRNNNPGNLRRTKEPWQGQATEQTDPDFIIFSSPVWGIRAIMKILLTYQIKYKLKTIRELINRYAPPSENDTEAYAMAIAKRLNLEIDDSVNLQDQTCMVQFCQGIVLHENGQPSKFPNYIHRDLPYWYPDDAFSTAYNLTFKN